MFSRGSKHRKKIEPFFSREYLFCIHKTIVDSFQGVSDTRLTRAFLSNNIQGINDYKRFVESKLENKVFEKDFKHEKDALGPKQFEHLIKEEVQNATNALKSWVIQVLSSDNPNYNTIFQKVDWFDGQLDLLKPKPRQLIQGIHRDMLDGTILHFLPVDANVILLDRWNLVGGGKYMSYLTTYGQKKVHK
jgi:hypothetical protein